MAAQPLSLLVVSRSARARRALCDGLVGQGLRASGLTGMSQVRAQWTRRLFDAIVITHDSHGADLNELLAELDDHGFNMHTHLLMAGPTPRSVPLAAICATRISTRKEVLRALRGMGAACHDLRPTDSSGLERYRKLLDRFDEGYWELSSDGTILVANWALHRMSGHKDLVGRNLSELFEPSEMHLLRTLLERQNAGIYTAFTVLMRHSDGSQVPIQVDPFPVPGAGRSALTYNALLRPAPGSDDPVRKEESGRERALVVLYMVATALTQPADIEVLLDDALRRLLDLTDLDAGSIWIAREPGHLEPAGTRGLVADPERRAAAMAAIRNFCAALGPAEKARVVQDLSEKERVLFGAGFRAAVAVPMEVQDRRIGVLWAASRQDRHLLKDIISLVISVSQQMALAVEHARMHEHRLDEEKGRREFYRNTVSAVTQGKLTIVEQAEIEDAWEEGVPLAHLEIQTTEDVARSRRLTEEALGDLEFPQDRIFDLVTCVSEAVTNALHYGTGGWLSLRYVDDAAVRARVTDNGPGIRFVDLPRAVLMRGYSTGLSLGLGYSVILELMDAVLLSTGPRGTSILMELRRTAPVPALPELEAWAEI